MNYQSNRPDIAQAGPVQWLAIGIQPQWGKILGDTVNLKIINFPVSFNECFGGLALFNGDPVAAAEYATITDITNTNFKIYMYANNAGTGYANANIFYLFLGAQPQWGYYVESQNPTDYRYWSIPFTSHYITMATKTYYEPKEEAVPWLVGIDMQKFICGYGANFIGSSYVSCVGIGCQLQWGTCGSGINNLPLSFNEKIFICVVTDITSSTTSSDGYFSFNNDKSTINSIFITSSGAYGGNYIVAGV